MKTIKNITICVLSVLMLILSTGTTASAMNTGDFVTEKIGTSDIAITGYGGSDSEVKIPEDLGITVIGGGAFAEADWITHIGIPIGVYYIADGAFENCISLTKVKLPDTITGIGNHVFRGCASLTSITIPTGVKMIGKNVFDGCGANFTIYGETCTYAEEYAKANNIKFVATIVNPTVSATPTLSKVIINGKAVSFGAYNISGYNYFKLRDLAMALNGSQKRFEVGYNDTDNAITLTSGNAYTAVGGELTSSGVTAVITASRSASKVYLDGKYVYLTAYNIGGYNYFKLRDVGATIDFGVGWDGAANTITIDTSANYVYS